MVSKELLRRRRFVGGYTKYVLNDQTTNLDLPRPSALWFRVAPRVYYSYLTLKQTQ